MDGSPEQEDTKRMSEEDGLADAELNATTGPADPGDGPTAPDPYELPTGLPLTSHGALPITRASRTRVVVLAGDQESGKTTLLACIYEMFRDGPFAGMLFAGSSTLPGFEVRCHEARVESHRRTPDTYRTIRSGSLEYLHLQLRDCECNQPKIDFLFSDITGEFFEEACESSDQCRVLVDISRADHFALLLDGEKLVDSRLRHNVMRSADQFLRRCLQEGLIDGGTRIDVLFAKWDVVPLSESSQRKLDFEANVVSKLKDSVRDSVASLRFHHISARPNPTSGLNEAFGVEALLQRWLQDGCRNWPSPRGERLAYQSGREMSRYLDRRFSERSQE